MLSMKCFIYVNSEYKICALFSSISDFKCYYLHYLEVERRERGVYVVYLPAAEIFETWESYS